MNVMKTQMSVMTKPGVKTLLVVMNVYATKDGLELEESAQV